MNSTKPRTTTDAAVGLARDDLACFSALTWPKFELAHHHRTIIEKLEAVERGEITRLIISEPPRHGKSLLGSQLFPAWYLGRNPTRSIIAASYGAELASDFGRRVRNLMGSPVFGAIFPKARMADDSAARHRFDLIAGGSYYAVGAGGPITGRGAHLLLIDDPTKNAADAGSEAYRKALCSWFESTAYTRLQGDNAAIVIIATRWHMADLPGWLLAEHPEEGWEVLSLPAIAETDEGWRHEGDALWPKRFPLKRLEQIRAQVGGNVWASLYQGRPAAAEGAIFKREWWKYWTEATLPARFEQIVLSCDTAFKAGTSNDYSVGLVLGVGPNGFYVLDVSRKRLEFPALKREIEMLALKWNPHVVLVEDKASGQSLLQELRTGTRLSIRAVRVDLDKVTRAVACTPLVESGRVFLPKGAPWLTDFLEEVSAFPAAPHDDIVDALSQGLNYVREAGSFGQMSEYYRGEFARELYSLSANFGTVAATMGVDVKQVEEWVADGDDGSMMAEYEQAAAEASALYNGEAVTADLSSTYGSRRPEPSIEVQTHRAIDSIMRGKG